ncbi:GGDEF domain-containing protein [Dongshaea marina]|uniref:GGDEF domain-containing protein n=1 Tax=Dongshaea marina TaxID=2047966 RepID=UPI000D3EC1E2|nr:GGDEF domain-containing protein [Dongshaea marina]
MPTLRQFTYKLFAVYIMLALLAFLAILLIWQLPNQQRLNHQHLKLQYQEFRGGLEQQQQQLQRLANLLQDIASIDRKNLSQTYHPLFERIQAHDDIHAFIYDGQIFWDLNNRGTTPLSQTLSTFLGETPRLPTHHRCGWYPFKDGLLLIDTQPLANGQHLLLVRELSGIALRQLALKSHLDYRLEPYDSNLSSQPLTAPMALKQNQPQLRLYLSNLRLEPSQQLTLISKDQRPLLWYFSGEIMLLFWLMMLSGCLIWSFHHFILKPLLHTQKQVGRTSTQGDPLPIQNGYTPLKELNHFVKSYNRLVDRVKAKKQQLEAMAHTDGLTGIYNRRAFDRHMRESWQRASRIQSGLALIICDVDYFKPYNDNYGHPAGDKVLIQLAELLSQHFIRATDFVARYGGEEFVIVAEAQILQPLQAYLESLQTKLRELAILHEYSQCSDYLTISIGASVIEHSGAWLRSEHVQEFIEQADENLYKAKAAGRNTIVSSIFE